MQRSDTWSSHRRLQKRYRVLDFESLENRYAPGAIGLSTLIKGLSDVTSIVKITSLLGVDFGPAATTALAPPHPNPVSSLSGIGSPADATSAATIAANKSVDPETGFELPRNAPEPSMNVGAVINYNSDLSAAQATADVSNLPELLDDIFSSSLGKGADGAADMPRTGSASSGANAVSPNVSAAPAGQSDNLTLSTPTPSSTQGGTLAPGANAVSPNVSAAPTGQSNNLTLSTPAPSSMQGGTLAPQTSRSTCVESAHTTSPNGGMTTVSHPIGEPSNETLVGTNTNTENALSSLTECLESDGESVTSLPPCDWRGSIYTDNYFITPSSDLWYTDGMDLSSYGYFTQIDVSEPENWTLEGMYPRTWELSGGSGIVTFAGGASTFSTSAGPSGGTVTLYAVGASAPGASLGVTLTCTQMGVVTAEAQFDVRQPRQLKPDGIIDNGVFGAKSGYKSSLYYVVCDQNGEPTGLNTPVMEKLAANWTPDATNNWPFGHKGDTVARGGRFHDNIAAAAAESDNIFPQPNTRWCPVSSEAVRHIDQIIKIGGIIEGEGPWLQTDTIQEYIDHGRHLNIVSPVN